MANLKVGKTINEKEIEKIYKLAGEQRCTLEFVGDLAAKVIGGEYNVIK